MLTFAVSAVSSTVSAVTAVPLQCQQYGAFWCHTLFVRLVHLVAHVVCLVSCHQHPIALHCST